MIYTPAFKRQKMLYHLRITRVTADIPFTPPFAFDASHQRSAVRGAARAAL